MEKTVPLIRCKGCLCYVELPEKGSPHYASEVGEFIHAHRYCPKKD